MKLPSKPWNNTNSGLRCACGVRQSSLQARSRKSPSGVNSVCHSALNSGCFRSKRGSRVCKWGFFNPLAAINVIMMLEYRILGTELKKARLSILRQAFYSIAE
ncbi:Uncharacterised protein [Vibrio cholerae]|nr:Uncharacterised protein [Vibrio cholerae]CSD29719.1 Uncharacterised protein [Vibrio cholerae]